MIPSSPLAQRRSSVPATKVGCPTSRSFFARCGMPRYSMCNSIGVIRSDCLNGKGVPLPFDTSTLLQQPPFPYNYPLLFVIPSAAGFPAARLIDEPGCGSLQREPHTADRSRNTRQEIRGSRGTCGASFVFPASTGLQPNHPPNPHGNTNVRLVILEENENLLGQHFGPD